MSHTSMLLLYLDQWKVQSYSKKPIKTQVALKNT